MVGDFNITNFYLPCFFGIIKSNEVVAGTNISVNTMLMYVERDIVVFYHVKITVRVDVNIDFVIFHNKTLCVAS